MKSLLPQHPSVNPATSSGFPFWFPHNDSNTCGLGHKLKFFKDWDQIYLKELKNYRRKIIAEASLLRLNKLFATGQSFSKLVTQPHRVLGSVIQSPRMWGTAWTSCTKPATLPQVSSSVHKQLKAKDTSKQAFSWKTRETSWSCYWSTKNSLDCMALKVI